MNSRIASRLAWSLCAISVALFNPVRRRAQELVDRQFNRSRYNDRRTIETLGTRLRDETELSALGADLTTVVTRTRQPESIAVWRSEES